jgi:hypothetical protein
MRWRFAGRERDRPFEARRPGGRHTGARPWKGPRRSRLRTGLREALPAASKAARMRSQRAAELPLQPETVRSMQCDHHGGQAAGVPSLCRRGAGPLTAPASGIAGAAFPPCTFPAAGRLGAAFVWAAAFRRNPPARGLRRRDDPCAPLGGEAALLPGGLCWRWRQCR